jgi:multicomponent Na+:H+ antiporter subunit A
MLFILVLYVFLAVFFLFIPGWSKKLRPFILALLQLGAFVFFFSKIKPIQSGSVITEVYSWIPQLNLQIKFTLDGLSLIFALLITGIGFLVFLYAGSYMKSYTGTGKFYFYLTLFSAAMLGMVLSTNMILLFIFWEITSILSFLLISFFHEKEEARKAAFQSLFITAFGGLSLLAGFILIGSIVNSYSLSDWIEHADKIRSSQLYLPSLLLLLVGVFTKSAQFPFHFWLPGAMQAPTPVSSYLHSATMVKAGVFLLARINPVLGGTQEWTYIIPLIGVITMLVGSYFAITQQDLKAILAYTTISALGILVLLLGIDTRLSFKAALLFLFVHAFYKASLFMIAGLIDKKTGTRNMDRLGGLIRFMPFTFFFAMLALFSMAGLPPMLGFLGKELIYEAKIQSPGIASLVLILGVTSNILMVGTSLWVITKVFLGKQGDYPKIPDEKGVFFLAGPAILVLLSLGFGLYPEFIGKLMVSALEVIHDEPVPVKLKLWHGFNQVFFLSLFTVTAGIILWLLIKTRNSWLYSWRKLNDKVFILQFSDMFTHGIDRFVDISKKSTGRIQHGYHRYYLLTILVFVSVLLWFQVYITRGWNLETAFSLKPFYISGLSFVIILATLFTLSTGSRIVAIISMGVMGYGISLIYMYYSAVDLAITQILVESLTVVMFVIILQRLPRFARLSARKTRLRDLSVSLIFGAVMTVLALKAIHVEFNHPVSDFFIENSYIRAFGENVVNVILVDFRALDTLGEVTVLTIAALGVYVLLRTKTSDS